MTPPEGRSLAEWPVGRPATLVDLGDDPAFVRRVSTLGLRRGATLVTGQRTPGRGVVVHVGELRLALDRESAARLTVREPSPAPSASGTPAPRVGDR